MKLTDMKMRDMTLEERYISFVNRLHYYAVCNSFQNNGRYYKSHQTFVANYHLLTYILCVRLYSDLGKLERHHHHHFILYKKADKRNL